MDLVLRNAQIFTCDKDWNYFYPGAIHIRGEKIFALGPEEELLRSSEVIFQKNHQYDMRGDLIIPGLINTHTHGGLSLFRGLCDRGDLFNWASYLAPYTSKIAEEEVEKGNEIAIREMIAAGITTACDCTRYGMGNFSRVAERYGMRSLSGALVNSPDLRPGKPDWPLALEETKRVMEELKGSKLSRFFLGVHSPYNCHPELIISVKKEADSMGLPFSLHLSETREEVKRIKKQYGFPPAIWLSKLGVLDETTLLAHCVWLEEDEIAILARKGSKVAHCPVSNAKLGSGIAPVPEFLQAGIQVGHGTDSVVSNNSLDIFQEMKMGILLQRGSRIDGEILNAKQMLEMATRGGAACLGWEKEIGSLEVGKEADMVVLNTGNTDNEGKERVISRLVFATGPRDVREVMVAGKFIYRNKEYLTRGIGRN